ncbi:TRAP transporter small permease [Pueribacillus theae]|uniref:TRAP transporter small permease n=1 Tax=Pueribacillus theae TaxID=2171751 RepID=A0A2U1JK63_9BACI|nr:TRAP transporter small permease [Pueribacillus theae]PWA05536.1 TRAP transporter small permease [Pueribacillus theae]
MKVVKWLDKNLEIFFMSFGLLVLVIIMGSQIFMRYVLNASLSWPEEISRYLFIWVAFIGISYAVKIDSHLKIDIVLEFVSRKVQVVFAVIRDLSFLIFSIFMIAGGIDVYDALASTMQTSPAMGIPFKFIYLALPVGFALTVFRIIQKYISVLRYKQPLLQNHNENIGGGV